MSDSYYVTPDMTQQIEQIPGIHRRTMATTERMMLCEFAVREGGIVPPHSHPHDQCGYVVSGKIEFTVGDVKRVLMSGDTYGVPGGLVHSATALEDTLLVEVFSPPRDEYR